MRGIMIITKLLSCAALAGYSQYKSQQAGNLNEVSVTGVFDGVIITVGNKEKEEVYKIDVYYIALADITQIQVNSLIGRKILVKGRKKVKAGRIYPARSISEGILCEPYEEPDKIFISEPTFTILE